MGSIEIDRDGQVLVARLNHGKANSLNRDVLDELTEVMHRAVADERVGAMVLASAVPSFFSAGFDVGEVFRYDGQQMRSFFGAFIDVYEGLQRLPIGIVAAVSGHAYAGGAVVALGCDWRVMAEGSVGFALNEVNVGISLPSGISRMVVGTLGAGFARQLLLTGEPIDPSEALRMGLVNETCPPDRVLEQAVKRAAAMAAKPRSTFAAIKRQIFDSTYGTWRSDREQLDSFIQEWDSTESRSARDDLLAALRAKAK